MATIGQKADHVRAAIREGDHKGHHCHWPGCTQTCAPAQWGCRKHWYMLPQALRTKIWNAYKPGQEQTKTPSASYLQVAREVRAWILANHPLPGP